MNHSIQKRTSVVVVAAAVAAVLAGCASTPKAPPGSEAVRSKLTTLKSQQDLAARVPVVMEQAEKAVVLAETPQRDSEIAAHRVYLADHLVDTARATAEARLAEEQREALKQRADDARLSARTREADSAQRAALAARTEAASSRVAAENSRIAASSAISEAISARTEADGARADAIAARTDANAAQIRADLARSEAVSARGEAETARNATEAGRVATAAGAAAAATAAQQQDLARERARVTEEQRAMLKLQGDDARLVARTEADAARTNADAVRAQADTARALADLARGAADTERTATEAARVAADAAAARAKQQELERQIALLQARTTERGIVLTLGDVLFASGSEQLKPGAVGHLDRLAGFMRMYPGRSATIEGHTDSVGEDGYNQGLSQRRADSVKAYLAGKGVPVSRLTSIGKGEAFPVAGNESAGGRQQNRRVEVVIGDEMKLAAQIR